MHGLHDMPVELLLAVFRLLNLEDYDSLELVSHCVSNAATQILDKHRELKRLYGTITVGQKTTQADKLQTVTEVLLHAIHSPDLRF